MGIKSFSKQMFSKSIKESFSYICSIAVTAMLVFVTINISFNDLIYGESSQDLITVFRLIGKSGEKAEMMPFQVSIGEIQQELILITIIIVGIFTVISNQSFLKKRLEELAFIIMNGATMSEMSYYIRYMCSKMFIIASLFGVILGVIFAPLFNILMYKIVGIEGEVFLYSIETFVVTLSFVFINYIYLMIASAAYVYKKEVDDLMSDNRTKNSRDNRMLKFPSSIYLLLYLSPLLILFLPKSYGDINGFVTIGIYLSALAAIGVISIYLPKKLKTINNLSFMEHKERKIYINNAFIKLKNVVVYIAGMVIAINYFLDKILEFKEYKGIVTIILFSMVVCVVVVVVALTNKIIDDCGIDKVFYKDLSAIGYSKKELFKISLKENRTTSIAILFFVLAPITFAILMHIKNGSLAIEMLIILGGITIIPILVGGVISYRVNKENLYEILEIKTKEILVMKTLGDFSSRCIEKLLIVVFNVSDDSQSLWKRNLIWKVKLVHVIGVVGIILVIPNILMNYISTNFKKDLLEMPVVGESKKGNALLDLYINLPKVNGKEGQAYFYKGIEEYSYIQDVVYYTHESKFSEDVNKDDSNIDEAIENHILGMKYSEADSTYYMKNAFALISLYHQNGEVEKAFEVIEKIKKTNDEKVLSYAMLSEGVLNLKINEYDKAIDSLKKVNSKQGIEINTYIAEAYRRKGDYKKAGEYKAKVEKENFNAYPWELRANTKGYTEHDIDFIFKDELNLNPNEVVRETYGFDNFIEDDDGGIKLNLEIRETYLDNILDKTHRGSIKGKLDIDGVMGEGIAILLTTTPRSHDNLAGISIGNDEEIYSAYVQKDGSFEFNNILNGEYFINLVIPKNKFIDLGIEKTEFINDAIKIEAKEVKDLVISKNDGDS